MEVCRRSSWLLLLLGALLLATTLQVVQGEVESEGPSESECRPYIEKALKELEIGDAGDAGTAEVTDSKEDVPTIEITTDDDSGQTGDDDTHEEQESVETADTEKTNEVESSEQEDTKEDSTEEDKDGPNSEDLKVTEESSNEDKKESTEAGDTSVEDNSVEHTVQEDLSSTDDERSIEDPDTTSAENENSTENDDDKIVEGTISVENTVTSVEQITEDNESIESVETGTSHEENIKAEDSKGDESEETQNEVSKKEDESKEEDNDTEEKQDDRDVSDKDTTETDSQENDNDSTESDTKEDETVEEHTLELTSEESKEKTAELQKNESEERTLDTDSTEQTQTASIEDKAENSSKQTDDENQSDEDGEKSSEEEADAPEEELSLDIEIPVELRPRDHVEHLLKLDDESSETETILNNVAEITLRELKKLYENAIKPLEVLYKYRDLSNRHFGDSEIFSKPLILFMGPWSGGKSSIINYLLNNEYNDTSLRTGAEPSPAYFNILMYGEEHEVIDGTQLAADFTFSGLQKFGQGLEERLRGVKLPSKLLEKVNIVEIPGILEVRKQVSRVFPFNDACQWFIDRADIIFLVYDPSKLDVGPETEAILDQLKGREHQTRIILNKADQVKPEELMRVQGALIWNISPLMSSAQPPIMYTTTLWSRPYEAWAPVKLLQAQERAFLRDLRSAVDKRIENKIASARRFAVRVRNHAKMVDCYLTTYYNHKSVFGNRKQVADEIIEHPQDYHIYEGLSTLTNISRYDLPDPDVYRDFFKLNPLYEFQQLSATCTYFRGCPINRLDVAIAYDLPELVGKHKRLVENALTEVNATPEGS